MTTSRPTVRDFRITAFDAPIGAFFPEDRQDWIVLRVSEKDMKDAKSTEVHRFRHWTVPNVYIRIGPPSRAKERTP